MDKLHEILAKHRADCAIPDKILDQVARQNHAAKTAGELLLDELNRSTAPWLDVPNDQFKRTGMARTAFSSGAGAAQVREFES